MGVWKALNVVFIISLFLFLSESYAENGVTDDKIILGQSCALTGPAKALGNGMRNGMVAYFNKINRNGGILGRKIQVISYDDGYEPDRAIINSRRLLQEDKVFLGIGYVGTPTSKAVLPMYREFNIPFLTPFTGAELLRAKNLKNVINLRASYHQEMEEIASYLVRKKGLTKIACFYQNDAYGHTGLDGITKALEKRSLNLVATGRYERNTMAVKSGLLKIRRAKPEAVVMVGAYKPCAEFIKLGKKYGLGDTVFCNISFVGTHALIKELAGKGEGTIVSQVVQCPKQADLPVAREFAEDLNPISGIVDHDFVSFEGYLAAKLFCIAAKKAGKDLTRESLIKAFEEAGTLDLGGVKVKYGKDDHQGMNKVFLTRVKAGKALPIEDHN